MNAGSKPATNAVKSEYASPWWSVAIGVAAFVAYLWLAPPVAGDGDSSELTMALVANGVPHPTGYPIWIFLGHYFVVLVHRLGATWDYAANAWSALGAALAIGLMHALATRLPPPEAPASARFRGLAAILPVALFVFNPVWTDTTSLAEVYSWQQAWAMGTALGFVAAIRHLTSPEAGGEGLPGLALGWGVLCGLGLSHHATSVLIAGPLSLVLIAVLATSKRLSPTLVGIALVGLAIPLSSYLSLLAKAFHPGYAVWSRLDPNLPSLISHMTGAQYRSFLGRFKADVGHARFLDLYIFPYLLIALPLMVIAALRSRSGPQRLIMCSLLAAALAQIIFCFAYGVPDPSSYFLPPLGITIAALAVPAVDVVSISPRARRLVRLAMVAFSIAALIQWAPYLRVGTGRRDVLVGFDRDVRHIWSAIPIDRGIVVWSGDLQSRLNEYQLFFHERPGLHLISPWEMTIPLPRDRFLARFRFDPYGDPATTPGSVRPPAVKGPAYDRFLVELAGRLHQATRQPVVLLSPRSDSLSVFDSE